MMYISIGCAVTQYAVLGLKANAKVNEKCENLHPRPSQTHVPIWTPFEIYNLYG